MTPEPVAKRSGGSDVDATPTSVGSVRPTPIPTRTAPGSIAVAQWGVRPISRIQLKTPAANATQPSAAVAPAPMRAMSLPPTIANTGTINGPGAKAIPVRSGDQPQASCDHTMLESSIAANPTL